MFHTCDNSMSHTGRDGFETSKSGVNDVPPLCEGEEEDKFAVTHTLPVIQLEIKFSLSPSPGLGPHSAKSCRNGGHEWEQQARLGTRCCS